MRLTKLLLFALLLATALVAAHGGHTTKAPALAGGEGGDSHGKAAEDNKMSGHMDNRPISPEEQARKEMLFLFLHVAIASTVVFATVPVSIAFIAGKKFEYHKQLSALNSIVLVFAGAVALMGFSDGDSFHAKFAVFAILFFLAQSASGLAKQYLVPALNMAYHRFMGVATFIVIQTAWWSGVYHLADCNETANSFQICNAHFFLGMVFCLVGLANLYYGDNAEFVNRMEMSIIAFAASMELLFEGLGDIILSASQPDFEWDMFARLAHLGTASIWLGSVAFALLMAWRFPSSLQRGLALVVGSAIHMVLLFIHDHPSNSLTPNAHLLHELALLPLLFARFFQLRRTSCFLLLVSGLSFCLAGEPVAESMENIFNVAGYWAFILFLAACTQTLHFFIHTRLLHRRNQNSTAFSRSGCARVFRVVFCMCCCPSLLQVKEAEEEAVPIATENKYEATALVEDDEDQDGLGEDVTSTPNTRVDQDSKV